MKGLKKILCVLITLCMMVPMATMMVSADEGETAFVGRTSEYTDNILFFDNIDTTAGTFTSGSTVYNFNGIGQSSDAGRADKYGMKLTASDFNTDGHPEWGVFWNFSVKSDAAAKLSTTKGKYFSIHYKVMDAEQATYVFDPYKGSATYNKDLQCGGNVADVSSGTGFASFDATNDKWLTHTFAATPDQGGRANEANYPLADQFLKVKLPSLTSTTDDTLMANRDFEGNNNKTVGFDLDAYYVIDYIGIFDSEEDAAAEAAFWEAYYAGTPIPYAPTASVTAGEYFAAQSVELASKTADAKLYYTTDGSDPTSSDTRAEYTGTAISVAATTTIKAVAYNETGDKYSAVKTFEYTISSNKVSDPVISGAYAGNVPAGTMITVTCDTEGATIRYTVDGSEPTATSAECTASIEITTANTTVKVKAFKENMDASNTVEMQFGKILNKNVYWTFTGLKDGSPDGQYTAAQGIYHTDFFGRLTTSGAGFVNDAAGALKWTVPTGNTRTQVIFAYDRLPEGYNATNGNYNYLALTYKASAAVDFAITPNYFNEGGTTAAAIEAKMSERQELTATETYKTVVFDLHAINQFWKDYCGEYHPAIFVWNKGNAAVDFSVLSMGFYVTEAEANMPVAATPAASHPSDSYTDVISVTLTSATEGASIYYTTDGTTPTTASTPYAGAITVSSNTTIKAIAVKDGCYDSQVATYTYEVTPTVATPEISLKAGKYEGNQTVTVTCATEGAKIYYTTDGSDPSATNGTLYAGPITLSDSCILKVVAVVEGKADSKVVSRTYNITGGSAPTGGDNGAAPAPTDTTAATTAAPTEEKKGCKSSIAIASVAMITLVSGAGVVLCRKKED